MSVMKAEVRQPAPFAVSTRAWARRPALSAFFRMAPDPALTSRTSASSPAASFFDRIDAVIRSIDSTVPDSSRIAYRRRSAGATSPVAATIAQPTVRTMRRKSSSGWSHR